MTDRFGVCMLLAGFAMVIASLAFMAGMAAQDVSFRRSLVESGRAEYVAGENGEPVWRLKEK